MCTNQRRNPADFAHVRFLILVVSTCHVVHSYSTCDYSRIDNRLLPELNVFRPLDLAAHNLKPVFPNVNRLFLGKCKFDHVAPETKCICTRLRSSSKSMPNSAMPLLRRMSKIISICLQFFHNNSQSKVGKNIRFDIRSNNYHPVISNP